MRVKWVIMSHITIHSPRLRNDLYCVEMDVTTLVYHTIRDVFVLSLAIRDIFHTHLFVLVVRVLSRIVRKLIDVFQ